MPTVRIQEKNYSESIMVLKLKDGFKFYHSIISISTNLMVFRIFSKIIYKHYFKFMKHYFKFMKL